ncbi:hypothetical protein [Ornithinibacillus halophilus]|nr:hypothetical protein [Ornithinibacillus halophilus]
MEQISYHGEREDKGMEQILYHGEREGKGMERISATASENT